MIRIIKREIAIEKELRSKIEGRKIPPFAKRVVFLDF